MSAKATSSSDGGSSGSSTTINGRSASGNNHAVIVSSSRYWFNYRHAVNALSIYQLCKANGIPDENIILMLADDLPSNARNPVKNGMYSMGTKIKQQQQQQQQNKKASNSGKETLSSLYDGNSIQIDYRGEDVTVNHFVRALLGRHGEETPAGATVLHRNDEQFLLPHLHSNEDSNVLIYLTGHGGDQFFKFQDIEEITSEEIARVITQMHQRKRYKQILLVADTCQAFTLGDHISAPNVFVVGSSLRGESSYAHHSDTHLGLSVIERYTHAFTQLIDKHGGVLSSNMTLKEAMVDPYTFQQQRANIGYREIMAERTMEQILLSEFFANNNKPGRDGAKLLGLTKPMLFNASTATTGTIKVPSLLASVTSAAFKSYPANHDKGHVISHWSSSFPVATNPIDTSSINKSYSFLQWDPVEPTRGEYVTAISAFLFMVIIASKHF